MLSQSCNALMRALGAEVGIPELELDETHCCTLAFDSVVVNFELDESGDQLFLYASLGLDREGDRSVPLQSLPAERVSEADLKVAVERFVDVAEAWTRRVSEVVAPPQDVAGERQASGPLTPDQFV